MRAAPQEVRRWIARLYKWTLAVARPLAGGYQTGTLCPVLQFSSNTFLFYLYLLTPHYFSSLSLSVKSWSLPFNFSIRDLISSIVLQRYRFSSSLMFLICFEVGIGFKLLVLLANSAVAFPMFFLKLSISICIESEGVEDVFFYRNCANQTY